MKLWATFFALATCLQAVAAAPAGKEEELDTSGQWPPANMGPEHVKSWQCAVPIFEGQKYTESGGSIPDLHRDIQKKGKLTIQPDGKWVQVACRGGGYAGVHWRNTGKKPKTVTGTMISYYVQLVRSQTNYGPEGGVPAGLVGPKCGVGESVLGTIKMKDDWEVNIGRCMNP